MKTDFSAKQIVIQTKIKFLSEFPSLLSLQVEYKWQRGFRRDAAGRYSKVTILKLGLRYEDSPHLLPHQLNIGCANTNKVGSFNLNQTILLSRP